MKHIPKCVCVCSTHAEKTYKCNNRKKILLEKESFKKNKK